MSTSKLQEANNKAAIKTNTISRINVENIPCYTKIGCGEQEKELGQRLLMDVHVDVDSSRLTSSDNVNDTLSYVEIHKIVQEIGKSKSHSLIEALAEDIGNEILKHPLVKSVKIKIHKPHIPYPEFQGNVSVEIERKKQ